MTQHSGQKHLIKPMTDIASHENADKMQYACDTAENRQLKVSVELASIQSLTFASNPENIHMKQSLKSTLISTHCSYHKNTSANDSKSAG